MLSSTFRAAVVAAVVFPVLAYGQAYRCDVAGRTVYQAVPCAGGTAVNTTAPSFGGSADDPVGEVRRLERERQRRSDLADIDRKYDAAMAKSQKDWCSALQGRVDRFSEHEKAARRTSDRDWYGAERKAAEARFDRECR